MNVIDYITITCNQKNVRLQITFDYMKNVIDYNQLRWQITITPCLRYLRQNGLFPVHKHQRSVLRDDGKHVPTHH
jgi:hypothetical protein